jgi:Ca2+-transporting ATPase
VNSKQISAWHARSVGDALADLNSSPEGLSTAEVSRRLAEVGLNRLELKAGRSTLEILWDQFSNIMLIMLLVVAAVSAGIDVYQQTFPKDAIAILVIVVLNGLLGYAQESRAQKALLALRWCRET